MNRNLKLVTFSLFVWGIGEGMFLLFQPLYLQQLGADPVMIGAVFGGVGIMTALTSAPSGYLSDRFGTRPIMWITWILATISAWLMALATSLPLFIVGLLLYGLTGSVLAPMNAYITSVRGRLSAERALSYTAAAYHLGTVLGPTLGGFLGEQYSLKLLYVIAAVLFIVSSILILGIQKPVLEIHHDTGQSEYLLRNTAFIRIATLGLLGLTFMVFVQPLAPVFLQDMRALNLQQIGFLGTIGSLGNVVLALTLGHLPARLAYLLAFPLVFAFAFLLRNSFQFAWFGLAYFLYGGYRLARTMLLALTRNWVSARDTGLAFGVIETANAVALIIAPPLSGLVYNGKPEHLFTVTMVGLALTLLLNLFLLPSNTPEIGIKGNYDPQNPLPDTGTH